MPRFKVFSPWGVEANPCDKNCPGSPSPLAAHPVEPFRETAFLLKSFSLRGQLPIQQIAREVQERERRIGHQLRRRHGLALTFTDRHRRNRPSLCSSVCVRACPRPLALVRHPSPHLFQRGAAFCLEAHQRRVFRRPLLQPALPQKILIIQPQLLQAGARHVRELEFRFLGRAAKPGCPPRCSARPNAPPAPSDRACGCAFRCSGRRTAPSRHRPVAPPESSSTSGSRHAAESNRGWPFQCSWRQSMTALALSFSIRAIHAAFKLINGADKCCTSQFQCCELCAGGNRFKTSLNSSATMSSKPRFITISLIAPSMSGNRGHISSNNSMKTH